MDDDCSAVATIGVRTYCLCNDRNNEACKLPFNRQTGNEVLYIEIFVTV